MCKEKDSEKIEKSCRCGKNGESVKAKSTRKGEAGERNALECDCTTSKGLQKKESRWNERKHETTEATKTTLAGDYLTSHPEAADGPARPRAPGRSSCIRIPVLFMRRRIQRTGCDFSWF